MSPAELHRILAGGETLTVEFKQQLNDRDLVHAAVCMVNGEGGLILIGVDDDGKVVGADPRHEGGTDPIRVAALIANQTSPSLVTVVQCTTDGRGGDVIVVTVPRSAGVTATADGYYVRRALDVHGKPQCLPMQPHEAVARLARIGAQDASAVPLPDATDDDLSTAELQRFRDLAGAAGDRVLTELADRDLVSALGFRAPDGGLTLGAVLLFGRTESIARHVPTHEVAFQVLADLEVRAQWSSTDPLVTAMVTLVESVEPYNPQEEHQSGLFRVGLPLYADVSLRELIANALVHRDFTRRGCVQVSIEDGALSISNPGGFPEGVTIANLLVAPPQARNPRLADAFKRAGLVERTGRGVNRVYQSQLELGRPEPDYGRSTQHWVEVRLRAGPADKELAAFIAQARRDGRPLPLDALQVLHEVREERRITSSRAGELLQVDAGEARATLNGLVERGYLEARGEGKGRTYHLSAALYRELGGPAAYVRTRGFDRIQQQEMVKTYVRQHGAITRAEAAELCHLSGDQASRLLVAMRDDGVLTMTGNRRTARYHFREGT
jgi:ATP-dependent DNA helicase RecG